ncbi:Z1 domain-containing protein [Curtobacterium flaccumfaciens]|uniref:Z1 domain-containing protein n=1 Tax=Curtobacterium flaccumfaciens TaxID=2035 RepID=A0A4R6DGF0_9MICO|nr:Z1 domain-containing protein [Curtobacterium flaccumfaciens]TDN43354.1 Z1 domain-containing protein [Curtobacterium flaccumfaciens]
MDLYPLFGTWAKQFGLDAAVVKFSAIGGPELAATYKEQFEADLETVQLGGPAIVAAGSESWYSGSSDGSMFWPPLRAHFRDDQNWGSERLNDLERAANKVVAHTPRPDRQRYQAKGLVVGYVQSGKTTNFTSVIAKLADEQYKFIIVLSGIHNGLRKQTQARLNSQLKGLNNEHWITLTDEDRDFGPQASDAVSLLKSTEKVVLAVVKKNATVLERLINWLSTDGARGALENLRVLIIDDEADQASVATGRINPLIRELLALFPRNTYIGYTATPFANVFIDPASADLYPKDFILNLPRPEGYFGTEMIFGADVVEGENQGPAPDGYDMVRIVPEDDVQLLRPAGKATPTGFVPTMTPDLVDAVRWFWLATAARRARGDRSHSTMLIHTSVKIDVQESFRDPLEELRSRALTAIRAGDEIFIGELRTLWERETARVDSMNWHGRQQNSFESVLRELGDVLDSQRVVLDNYRSTDRLDYSSGPVVAIAVGGNTLSRGLTLEGLVVSFFVRTASAYDTLLQMARWFGFRPGYEDLPRIWMTHALERAFRHLATVEREMRDDIDQYQRQNLRPTDVAVRIKTHPSLAITAKMGAAAPAEVSYAGRRLQTRYFLREDGTWLENNLAAASDLIQDLSSGGREPEQRGLAALFRDVPAHLIVAFLRRYNVHEDSADMMPRQLIRYIDGQRNGEHPALEKWTVAVVQSSGAKVALGGRPFGSVIRSRLDTGVDSIADIKTLMSKRDRVLDLPTWESYDAARPEHELVQQRERDTEYRSRGLLVLYPIDAHSEPVAPARGGVARVPMDAVAPVIGYGIVFPGSVGGGTTVEVTHMAVDLAGASGSAWDEDEEQREDLQEALYSEEGDES